MSTAHDSSFLTKKQSIQKTVLNHYLGLHTSAINERWIVVIPIIFGKTGIKPKKEERSPQTLHKTLYTSLGILLPTPPMTTNFDLEYITRVLTTVTFANDLLVLFQYIRWIHTTILSHMTWSPLSSICSQPLHGIRPSDGSPTAIRLLCCLISPLLLIGILLI